MNYANSLNTYSSLIDPIILLEDEEGKYYSRSEFPFQEEAYKIIGAFMEVHKVLGRGFLESVYHEALCIELTKREIPFEANKVLNVHYKDIKLKKTFTADIFAYHNIIVELKAIDGSLDPYQGQVINYLSATNLGLGLLFNFGMPSLHYKRVILSINLKK